MAGASSMARNEDRNDRPERDPARSRPSWLRVLAIAVGGVLAAVLYVVAMTVASALVGMSEIAPTTDPEASLRGLLVMAVLSTVAIGYPILRSRWTGWRLVLALFVACATITPLLTQTEALLFLVFLVPIMPVAIIPSLVLQGLLATAIYVPLAVLLFGRLLPFFGRPVNSNEPAADHRLKMSAGEWAWKLALAGVVYAIIYVAFGALVAVPLAGPAFAEYYGDLVMPAWLLLFQVARGAVWVAALLPVVRMMRGRWWEAGLACALLSSILTAVPLILPNPFMPEPMRLAHFVELLSSNFVFGWTTAFIFLRLGKSRAG